MRKAIILLACTAIMLGCNNTSSNKSSYQEGQERLEELQKIEIEQKKEEQRHYDEQKSAEKHEYESKKQNLEWEFGINSAESWLKSRIRESSYVEKIELLKKEMVSTIKMLNVTYTGRLNMNDKKFEFSAEGITFKDKSFKYTYVLEKINGQYCLANTNSPHGFEIGTWDF